ncbi:hypothetical protein JCM30760_26740 [Thiomicrorhabdus hydrogeniphila]
MTPENLAVQIKEVFDLEPESLPVLERMLEDLSIQNYRVESLSMLVKKLVHSMRKDPEHNERLAKEAMDYLKNNVLIGSPLR